MFIKVKTASDWKGQRDLVRSVLDDLETKIEMTFDPFITAEVVDSYRLGTALNCRIPNEYHWLYLISEKLRKKYKVDFDLTPESTQEAFRSKMLVASDYLEDQDDKLCEILRFYADPENHSWNRDHAAV